MGIKGTVRRSTDGHIIHANIDTDVIIAEEPPYGMYACVLHAISLACYVSRLWKCVRLIKVTLDLYSSGRLTIVGYGSGLIKLE